MIKCMLMLRRRPELSREEFARYWSQVHSRLAIETAPAMGMVRYVQNHVASHPICDAFQQSRGCEMADFDGVAEAWWPSFDAMAAAAGSLPADVAETILADEARFVDLARSLIFFADEHIYWPIDEQRVRPAD